MKTEKEHLKLENLSGGAVLEKFNSELNRLLSNVMDPNATDKKRKITLTLAIKRNDARTIAEIEAAIKLDMAPAWPLVTQGFIGRDINGKAVCNEIIAAQKPILQDNVRPMKK